MKCRRCREVAAVIELPSHHAAFCPECFFVFFKRQVREGIRRHRLLSPRDRVLVCVSGGKDSLVLWDVLMDMGYETEGLYVDLGIEGYSDRSREKVIAYAEARGKQPIIVELAKEGIPIPEAARYTRMQECSICGTVKRYFFNRIAKEGGFSVVATGHNLDDESARLLGNLVHWQREHLARQHPHLPASAEGLVKKVKPLWRVSELETAAYGFLKEIDYLIEECPMSERATSLVYKEALSHIEERMPGSRIVFYQGFLDKANPLRTQEWKAADASPLPANTLIDDDADCTSDGPENGAEKIPYSCASCGAMTYAETCAYCRLKELIRKRREKRAKTVSP